MRDRYVAISLYNSEGGGGVIITEDTEISFFRYEFFIC